MAASQGMKGGGSKDVDTVEKQECRSASESTVEDFLFVACAEVKREPEEAANKEVGTFEESCAECEVCIKEEMIKAGSFEEISVPGCNVHIKKEVEEAEAIAVTPALERDPLTIEEEKVAAGTRGAAAGGRLTQNPSTSSDGAHLQAAVGGEREDDTVRHEHIVSCGRSSRGLRYQTNRAPCIRHDCSENDDERQVFTCSECAETFSSKYALIMHVFTHSDGVQPPGNVCRLCGEVFSTEDSLHNHMGVQEAKHASDKKPLESANKSIVPSESVTTQSEDCAYDSSSDICGQYILPHGPIECSSNLCNISDIQLSSPSHLASRLTEDSVPGPYKCDYCGRSFKHSVHLKQHTVSHTRKKSYECIDCGRTFKQSLHLKQHALSHTGERPHVCACGSTFAQLSNLKRHAALHTGQKPYTCDVCDKSFTNAYLLRRHVLVHTGERSYVCSECGSSFKQLVHLKQHAVCHTGEKPYTCDVCFKSFTQLGSLRRHAVVHTGEKPYTCEVCLKSFNTVGVLRRHEAVVHGGERPYVCRECGKSFKEVGHLKKHSVLHSGSRAYVCRDCGKAFTQSGSLNRHSTVHRGKEVAAT